MRQPEIGETFEINLVLIMRTEWLLPVCKNAWFLEKVTENFVTNAIYKETEVIDTCERSRLSLVMLLWWKLH